jgi:hypothetical protein
MNLSFFLGSKVDLEVVGEGDRETGRQGDRETRRHGDKGDKRKRTGKRGGICLWTGGFVPSVVAVDQRTREPQPEGPDKPVVDKLVAEVPLPVAAAVAAAAVVVVAAAVAVAGLVLLRRRRVVIQKDPRVASST